MDDVLSISFPPLCPGELIESWLIWFCDTNHDQSAWLIRKLGIEEVVTQGLGFPDHAFHVLHQISEVAEATLRAAHVHSYADTLGLAYGRNYGIRGGLLKIGQVAYKVCPECLIADKRPFIRLAWALEMPCFCPVHSMPLLFD